MLEQHPYRPVIPPVPEGTARPLWSVMIPTYNCAKYLRETLASVLVQDPGPDAMQITVVDDHSTQDDPEAVVRELGGGRVEFYRQPHNVGVPGNFQSCLELSRGYLIHQLHGDDYVKDGFYQKMERAFTDAPEIGAAFCRNWFVDEQGEIQRLSRLEVPESGVLPGREWLEQIVAGQLIQTPSIVVRREVYEQLGGFDRRLACSEDWEMWARIASYYPMWYETEPLAFYRERSISNSKDNIVNGIFIQKTYEAIEIFQSYIPREIPSKICQKSKQNCAFFSLQTADKLIDRGDFTQAISQILNALKYSFSYRVIRSAGRIILLDGSKSFIKTVMTKMTGERNVLKT
jgi:glycosyltransferase involved in cell wall biosynthesis